MESCDLFSDILQGCFVVTGTINGMLIPVNLSDIDTNTHAKLQQNT